MTTPQLSWRIESEVLGEKQTAYQVLVSSFCKQLGQGIGNLWDSGKVTLSQSQYIVYAGKPLVAKMQCYWKVRIWDVEGKASAWSHPARWTMGLFRERDWQGQWISTPAAPNDKAQLTVNKATYRTLDGSVAVDVTAIVKKELAKQNTLTVDPTRWAAIRRGTSSKNWWWIMCSTTSPAAYELKILSG